MCPGADISALHISLAYGSSDEALSSSVSSSDMMFAASVIGFKIALGVHWKVFDSPDGLDTMELTGERGEKKALLGREVENSGGRLDGSKAGKWD